MKPAILSVVALLAGLAACREPAAPPPVEAISFLSSGNPVVASANGGAQRIRNDELFELSFTAVKHADGSVIGNYHVARQDLGFNFDVDVTCMAVVADTAWIGGIIRKVNGPIVIEGTVSYFYVIDKGEGSTTPVDIASAIRVNDRDGEDLLFCTNRPTLLARGPIDFGNLQVRSF